MIDSGDGVVKVELCPSWVLIRVTCWDMARRLNEYFSEHKWIENLLNCLSSFKPFDCFLNSLDFHAGIEKFESFWYLIDFHAGIKKFQSLGYLIDFHAGIKKFQSFWYLRKIYSCREQLQCCRVLNQRSFLLEKFSDQVILLFNLAFLKEFKTGAEVLCGNPHFFESLEVAH